VLEERTNEYGKDTIDKTNTGWATKRKEKRRLDPYFCNHPRQKYVHSTNNRSCLKRTGGLMNGQVTTTTAGGMAEARATKEQVERNNGRQNAQTVWWGVELGLSAPMQKRYVVATDG